jgi:hypothetical protein
MAACETGVNSVVSVVLVPDVPVTVVAVADMSVPVAVPTLMLVVVGVAAAVAAVLPSVVQGPVLGFPPVLPVTVDEVIVKW